MEQDQRHRGNYLSIGEPFLLTDVKDGGSTGLPALFILKEMLSRLAFDLNSDTDVLPWRHFDIIIGTGRGG